MSVSLNSQSSSTEAMKEAAEEVAELSQNHDEALDLSLGLGALAGLRHGQACEDRRKSIKRYEDRNHRLHEARMARLGLSGEDSEGEEEEEGVAQQVLIRSPIVHNYPQPAPEPQTPPPTVPAKESNGILPWALGAAAVAVPLSIAAWKIPEMFGDKDPSKFVDTDTDTNMRYTLRPDDEP